MSAAGLPPGWREGLRQRYRSLVAGRRREQVRWRRQLRAFRLAWPLSFVLFAGVAGGGASGVATVAWTLELALLAAWLHHELAGAADRLRFHASVRARRLRRASPSELPGLQASVRALAEAMGIEREVVVWWSRFSTSPFPAVVDGWRRVHLVVPDGMATLPHDVGAAMIAHELGHVAQDDICLWARASASGSRVYRVATLGMALSLVATPLLLADRPVLLVVAVLGKALLVVGMRRQRRLMAEARRESDRLADLAAAAFGPGVDALLRALALARSGGPTDAQLAPGARMAWIRRLVAGEERLLA